MKFALAILLAPATVSDSVARRIRAAGSVLYLLTDADDGAVLRIEPAQ